MFRSAGGRRVVLVVVAAVTLVVGSCVTAGDETEQVVAVKQATPTVPSTTTTTTTTMTPTTGALAAAAPPSVKRVRVLPGDRPARPAKQPAAYRGPTPKGRIMIPRIGLNHLTYEGIEMSVIDYGPSHWPGTAMPGEVGNSVFPGHRVTKTRPFYDIDLIQIGDHVTFQNARGRFTYEVTDAFVVDDEETWIANPTDTPTFTIFACHPKGSAKQRYVVKGKLFRSERATSSEPTPDDGHTAPGDSSSYAPPAEETTTTTQPRSFIPRLGG